MAAPVIASTPTTAVTSGNQTSLTINKPTGVASGDLLVGIVQADAGTTWTDPTGWTHDANTFDSSDSSGAGSTQTRMSYRVADGTEGASFQWSSGTSRGLCGIIYRITGQAASAFITKAIDTTQTSFSSTATSPSLACPTNHCLVLWGGSLDNTRTISSVSGATLTVNQDVAGGFANNGVLFATGNSTDSGTNANTGTATWTLSSAATLTWLGYTIVIKPPSAAGGLLLKRRRD